MAGEGRLSDSRLAEIREHMDNIGARGRYSGAVTPSEVIYHEDVRSLLAEVERLRAQMTLIQAQADGAASLLLDVQQDCVRLRAENAELRDIASSLPVRYAAFQQRQKQEAERHGG